MDTTKKVWTNGIFFIVTLAINTLGGMGIINGMSQKEISDRYTTLITPSPSTFSIWGLIFTLLFVSLAVMIVKKDNAYYQKATDEISILFRISCVFNIIWMLAFSYLQIELSTVFILVFAITLAFISLKLNKIHTKGHFLLPLTFGIYTGWVFIATVVNVAVALVKVEWNGFGVETEIWAIITLIIGLALAFVVLTSNKNVVFPLPIAWAYLGIYQFLKSPDGFNGEYGLLQLVSLGGMAILIGMSAIQLYKNEFKLLPQKKLP